MLATVWNNAIIVDAPKSDARVATLQCARYVVQRGKFFFPRTLAVARRLQKRLGSDLVWSNNAATQELLAWMQRYDLACKAKDADELPDVPQEKMKSWRHQRRGFWFAYHMQSALLSQGMGTGKTKEMFDLIAARRAEHGISRVLVLTTASAVEDWPMHKEKHASVECDVLQFVKSHNARKKAEKLREAMIAHGDRLLIVVLSHQMLITSPLGPIRDTKRRLLNRGILDELCDPLKTERPFEMIIVDEIHKLSSSQGKMSLAASSLGDRVRFKLGASGTVIKHKPEDLFGVFRFIDPGAFGYRFDKFAERYCEYNIPSREELRQLVLKAKLDVAAAASTGDEEKIAAATKAHDSAVKRQQKLATIPRFIVGYKKTDELSRIMHALMYHCDSSVLDLPIPIHKVERVEMSATTRRVYTQLENELISKLESGEIVSASNKLSGLLRLQQVTSGFVSGLTSDEESDEPIDAKDIREVDDAKEKALVDYFESIDSDEPITVFCRFRHDLDVVRRSARKVDRECFEQSGRRKDKARFVAATGGSVLAAQIASASEAIDLTKCAYAAFYSLGFSLFQYEQAIKRLDRPGQLRQPCFTHFIMRDSVDEKVYGMLKMRADVIKSIIDEYLERRRATATAATS